MSTASKEHFPPLGLQDALAQSAVRGTFTDTAYYLYSHRLLSGKVGKPRIIYGNSLVMNAAGQHFRGQLSAAFSKIQDIPVDIDADEYGYQSDSDLEDDWNLDDIRSPTSTSSGSKKGKFKAEDTDSAEDANVECDVPKASSCVEHTVLITDIAANTWEALLFYIYTGTIFFAPLRCEGAEERMCAIKQYKHDHPHRPPLCSPKSVYRLADKIGLDELKQCALVELKRKMNPKTVLDEVFSQFASWYPDIMKMETDFFCDYAISSAPVMLGLQQKIRSVVRGDMPHTDNVLISLLQRLPITTIDSPPTFPAGPITTPPSTMIRVESPASSESPTLEPQSAPQAAAGNVTQSSSGLFGRPSSSASPFGPFSTAFGSSVSAASSSVRGPKTKAKK